MIHQTSYHIRPYQPHDLAACLQIFQSNCPAFFDVSEKELFIHWLQHQGQGQPVYPNTIQDYYFVIESDVHGLTGCGGYYVLDKNQEARLAWGMIHAACHKQGYGTALYAHRRAHIHTYWPGHTITLGTSQHTFPFYEKMGMQVMAHQPQGYGKDLDRYDMQIKA